MRGEHVAMAVGVLGSVAWALSIAAAADEEKEMSPTVVALAAVPMVLGVAAGMWMLKEGVA